MNVITACFFILLNSNVLLNGAETDLEKHGYTKNKQGLRNAFKYSIQSKNHSLFSSVFIYSECKDIVFLDKDEAWSYICGEEFVNKFNISYCSYYLVRNYINELRNDELRDIYTNQYNSMFESPKRYTSAHCSMEI